MSDNSGFNVPLDA